MQMHAVHSNFMNQSLGRLFNVYKWAACHGPGWGQWHDKKLCWWFQVLPKL